MKHIKNILSALLALVMILTLAACAGGHSAAPAARAMAVQLCGERRVNSARPALERILASPDSPEILRRSASHALARLR